MKEDGEYFIVTGGMTLSEISCKIQLIAVLDGKIGKFVEPKMKTYAKSICDHNLIVGRMSNQDIKTISHAQKAAGSLKELYKFSSFVKWRDEIVQKEINEKTDQMAKSKSHKGVVS